jgi:glycosyltransferase involved in cell wall biosynthesis
MTVLRRILRTAYHLFDQLLLGRLPYSLQRRLIAAMLRLAKIIRPSGNWPSVESLLVRRVLLPPPPSMRTLPLWAIEDLRDLSIRVDPLLTPELVLGRAPVAFMPPLHWTQAGHAYQRLRQRIGNGQFDTIILVPWLKRGGADLGALHHARACKEVFDHRTLVLATEIGSSPWADRLDPSIPFIELGPELSLLSNTQHEQERVLARLLIQLAPKRIHIINSHTAWRSVERYGKAIRQNSRVFSSLYCDELSPEGRREGLAQHYLPTCHRWLDAVITDNSASPRDWCRTLGADPALFHVVHFPAPHMPPASAEQDNVVAGKRLLWASRLERQKRPDVLISLAESMPDFHWDVHGSALNGNDPHLKQLKRMRNVSLHGSYERFADIVSSGHLAYVYTTRWDGLPNVLLEAASCGIAIVAPNVGGISDLIRSEQLVSSEAPLDDYKKIIRSLVDMETRAQWLSEQKNSVCRFTWERFIAELRRVPHYAQPDQ